MRTAVYLGDGEAVSRTYRRRSRARARCWSRCARAGLRQRPDGVVRRAARAARARPRAGGRRRGVGTRSGRRPARACSSTTTFRAATCDVLRARPRDAVRDVQELDRTGRVVPEPSSPRPVNAARDLLERPDSVSDEVVHRTQLLVLPACAGLTGRRDRRRLTAGDRRRPDGPADHRVAGAGPRRTGAGRSAVAGAAGAGSMPSPRRGRRSSADAVILATSDLRRVGNWRSRASPAAA